LGEKRPGGDPEDVFGVGELEMSGNVFRSEKVS
jgi:hypothetical protein